MLQLNCGDSTGSASTMLTMQSFSNESISVFQVHGFSVLVKSCRYTMCYTCQVSTSTWYVLFLLTTVSAYLLPYVLPSLKPNFGILCIFYLFDFPRDRFPKDSFRRRPMKHRVFSLTRHKMGDITGRFSLLWSADRNQLRTYQRT